MKHDINLWSRTQQHNLNENILFFFFLIRLFAIRLDVQHLIQIDFVRTGKKSSKSFQLQMPKILIQCLVMSFGVFILTSRDFGETF